MALSFNSPYYPYPTVHSINNTLVGAEMIPQMLLTYMLDLPDANGYQPKDDNTRPRVRFIKYVTDDGDDPLSSELPSPKTKLSLLFDPTHPDINTDEDKKNHPLGYRMMWQHVRKESLLEEQTLIKCYLGRIFSSSAYRTTIGVRWDIWTAAGQENNIKTGVASRSFAIEQAIRESFANVNMTGVGAFSFSRSDHVDNGSNILWTESSVMGRTLHMSIDWVDPDTVLDSLCDEC